MLFVPIPSVQPVTVIVAAAGVALGPRRGFAVGALAAIASNMFLGQGAHTPWQMLAWGGCGVLAGVFRLALRRRLPFAVFCAVLGMAFGTVMDLWLWFAFYPHTWAALVTVLAAGVAFNIAHAARQLRPRARRRARVAARPRPARAQRAHRGGVGVKWVAATRRVPPCSPGAAAGATGPAAGSAAFLASRQSASGGFAEQGRAPDGPLTAWAALGLVAAGGSEPSAARAVEFLRTRPADIATDADLALRVVALAALGETIDEGLLARLRGHRPDVLVNETIWTVLALRAAGEQPPPALVRAILDAQAKGGGFPWSAVESPTRTTRPQRSRRSALQAWRRRAPSVGPWSRCVRFGTATAATR